MNIFSIKKFQLRRNRSKDFKLFLFSYIIVFLIPLVTTSFGYWYCYRTIQQNAYLYHYRSISRLIFDILNTLFFILVIFACLLPVLHVVFASFSDPSWVMRRSGVILYIKGFNLEGYKLVLQNQNLISGYLNTFLYVIATTAIGLLLTVLTAYVVSRKNLLWSNAIMFFITFTMLFNGGMIATYIIVTKVLNLYDNRWAVILPVCLNGFYIILVRTAMQSLPDSLIESAMIDGANHLTILFKITLPLIKATLATVALYYVVSQWNSWFQASIYLRSRSKFPLQLVLKEILVTGDTTSTTSNINVSDYSGDITLYKQLIKYCTIVISTVPIFIFYPFIQKYFEKGVMIGAIKG